MIKLPQHERPTPHSLTGAADPQAVLRHLDAVVVGHESAKREMALAACRYLWLHADGSEPATRTHGVVVGPTGTGKRLLVATTAAALGLPFVAISAERAALETGTGFAVELLRAGGRDLVRQRRGIVYIDDADQLAPVGQSALAWLLGDTARPVAVLDGELVTVPTNRLMFVLGGEFARLDASSADAPGDLIPCGTEKALARRLQFLAVARPLSADELDAVLARAAASPLRARKREFAATGVVLSVDPSAREALVRRAALGGAPALGDALDRVLKPLAFLAIEQASAGFSRLVLKADPDREGGLIPVWEQDRIPRPPAPPPAATADVSAGGPIVLPPRPPRVGRAGRRWASETDLRPYLDAPAAHHATRYDGVTVVVETEEDGSRLGALRPQPLTIPDRDRRRHMLVVGATGSGKTARFILPTLASDLADPDRGVVVIDAQLELTPQVLAMHRRFRPNAPFYYLNFTDPKRSLKWNPFRRVNTLGDARVVAKTIQMAVAEESADSPFFREQATKLLARLIRALRAADPADCHPGRVQEIIGTSGKGIKQLAEVAFDSYLAEVAELLRGSHANTQTSLQELENYLAAWEHEAVSATTSRDEFGFEVLDAAVAPTVLVAIPEEMVEVLRPATACFVNEFLRYVMTRGRGTPGLVARPVSLIVDEFASAVGRLPDLAVRINTLRKRGLCLVAAVQSLRQICVAYGVKEGDELLGGFRTRVFVPPVDEFDAAEAAKASGFQTVQRVTTADGVRPAGVIPTREPVLSADEVNALPAHATLGPRVTVLLPDALPFQAYFPAMYENPDFRDVTTATELPPLRSSTITIRPGG